MKKTFFICSLLLAGLSLKAQQISIIPEPANYSVQEGKFTINSKTVLLNTEGNENAVNFLNNYLQKYYGFKLKTAASAKNNFITFENISMKAQPNGKTYPNESYFMDVTPSNVKISYVNAAGGFYGVQSLIQLLPTEKSSSLAIQCVSIEDQPRFEYRGMHLDVARHFFNIEFVKQYIDMLAMHKMNKFHWHLTDDQGWRIEIKKHPKLTQIGSCRNGTIIGPYSEKAKSDGKRYCGYYTQAQIKEVIKYAEERYVTVIPEIELPGHALAALSAYAEIGCTGGPYTASQTWGVFDDVFCAGNEKTFEILQDVLDEVIALFPSEYIHIGGDECPKTRWKACPKCQQRMKDNNLKDEHELQSYFVHRIEKFVNSKGRQIIGWDEILEGGLAPNATVMSWRGEEGGIEAAKQQHNVIMTPTAWCYFDYSQSKKEDSLSIGGYVPVEKVYSFDPIPAKMNPQDAKYVWGAQCNLWTEYIHYPSKVEYKVLPRSAALAEVVWSPKKNRDWNDFQRRLQTEFKRYDLWKVKYNTKGIKEGS